MMGYCPTCGHEVTESQKFCPNCSTRLRGAGAPRETPPADLSTSVPRRPAGGWSLEDEPGERDDLDDFFSSYRRKGPEAAAEASSSSSSAETPFPTRRSRRRFDPDLSYDGTPLPAAPRPAASEPARPAAGESAPARPAAAEPQSPAASEPARAAASEPARPAAPVEPEPRTPQTAASSSRPEPADVGARDAGYPPVSARDEEPAPVAAQPATNVRIPSWFEELDRDRTEATATEPAAPNPFARAAEAGTWGGFSAAEAAGDADADANANARPASRTTAGQPDAGEGRRFDEVLTGSHEPGTETSDQPIVSRDFDRTGIVHVPRLDDGTPPPRSTSRANADAGRGESDVAPLPAEPTWAATGEAPSPFQQQPGRNDAPENRVIEEPAQADAGTAVGAATAGAAGVAAGAGAVAAAASNDDASDLDASRGTNDTGETARDVFADWFGSEPDEDDALDGAAAASAASARPATPAAPAVDAAAERQRPWYEQGLDGTELDGVERGGPQRSAATGGAAAGIAGATAAGQRAATTRSSAPSYQAPAGPGRVPSGGGAGAAGGAPVDARGTGRGPAGSRGPGGSGPGGRGPGDGSGGLRGVLAGLDPTGRRRLMTIAIALVGSILLVLSAVIIGNVIGARDGQNVAATTEAATEPAAPVETEAPATPAGPPPAVADPNFEAVAFENASGNLRCIITPEIGVACQHSQPGFAIPAAACDSTDAAGIVVGLDSNGHTFPCLEDDIPRGQEKIEYDTPLAVGEFVCSIDDAKGVTCFNAAGDIFTLDYRAVSFAGRASESPQPTTTIPPVAE